ncbi:rac GTPase-activating protein 1 isoform X2 [Corythoichthys intestinalis]|uniref:rac GTPase-activating protein 1 isoform X2 n=1 Tax=Corythoichthys intestinalis TaxID=161448 RepID=UPI0025A5E507|nr:rac GTPase-activating protein 1 isoform X2 [Corythoichthys intestinalis]
MAASRLITEELVALFVQRISAFENATNAELEFIEVAKNFESVRKRWLHAETELKKYKELLVKSDVAKAALEVKLKHARNQLDVEMRKRCKVENDYQYLKQMQLMCDILVHDSKSGACLNAEQKSLLAAFEHKGANKSLRRSGKRLSAIDESSFCWHSDISYDRTDDDVAADSEVASLTRRFQCSDATSMKPLRSRARERRRSSMGLPLAAPVTKTDQIVSTWPQEPKIVEKTDETAVKEQFTTPETEDHGHAAVGTLRDTPEAKDARDDGGAEKEKCQTHVFLSKTVIRPEVCSPCGKRIRFGKVAVKCRNCRVVCHTECKVQCGARCAVVGGTGLSEASGRYGSGGFRVSAHRASLEGLAPAERPRIPALVVQCVKEIERRGLQERGLYRVPGGERQIKELRDGFLAAKAQLQLSSVSDIHVVCGLLKDFLRKLKEPLLTFKLHGDFAAAAEMSDERKSSAAVMRAVAELPGPNRDTLAFLVLHFYKVIRSPRCQMDKNNISRVFGPTLVGHGLAEPSPSTVVRDANAQPKVIYGLLSLPEDYWRHLLAVRTPSSQKGADGTRGPVRFFEPLMSPEVKENHFQIHVGKGEPSRRFFTSPT